MQGDALTVLGLMAAPIMTLVGVVVTTRMQARKAARESEATDQAHLVDAYRSLTADLRAERAYLDEQARRLDERLTQVSAEREQDRRDRDELRRQVEQLRADVAEARDDVAQARDSLGAFTAWVRRLFRAIPAEARLDWPPLPPTLTQLIWHDDDK